MGSFQPAKSDKFTFGLWTLQNNGRDPFGEPTRPGWPPLEMLEKLSDTGAYGVNLHDHDLVGFGRSAGEEDRIVAEFRAGLENTGLCVPMATTNLFTHPIFRDGAFTSNDPKVRAFAYRKVMRSMDIGHALGAKVYVFWGGREGAEVDAGKDAVEASKRMRDAMNFLCEYSIDQGYEYRFALEAKPNEPRGDIYLPTTGAMLGFISTLDHPEMVGVNPEVAHETMAGLNFYHAVAQAVDAGKLFHIDLNGQKTGPLRPRPALRQRGPEGRVPADPPARGDDGRQALRRPAPLRRARLPHRGRGRGVGLRARLHAHLPDAA